MAGPGLGGASSPASITSCWTPGVAPLAHPPASVWGGSDPKKLRDLSLRVTRDLPRRSPSLSPAELFRTFVTAVFYVGKGTRARPWWHLHQALAQHRRGTHRVGMGLGLGNGTGNGGLGRRQGPGPGGTCTRCWHSTRGEHTGSGWDWGIGNGGMGLALGMRAGVHWGGNGEMHCFGAVPAAQWLQ